LTPPQAGSPRGDRIMFDDRISRINKLLRRARDKSSSHNEREAARNALFAALDGMGYGPYDVAIIERGDATKQGLEKMTLDLIKAISEKDKQILDLSARQGSVASKPLLGAARASIRTKEQRILDHLRKHGSITSTEAVRLCGAMRPASAIQYLRKKGHTIVTERVKDGSSLGRYTLVRDARDRDLASGAAEAAPPDYRPSSASCNPA
jgi:hypothetical protein